MAHRGHREEGREKRIADGSLRRDSCEREHLVPGPVGLLERALARDEIREQFVEARLAARQVLRHVVADLLEDQIVLRRVGDE